MDPIPLPKTVTVYTLVKQSGATLNYIGGAYNATNCMGYGFFLHKIDAEHQRTLELLKEENAGVQIHMFELTVPNPVYKA
jgi:hypothetical protein